MLTADVDGISIPRQHGGAFRFCVGTTTLRRNILHATATVCRERGRLDSTPRLIEAGVHDTTASSPA
ncbi:hypothetical protein CSOJ01_02945 [Colletotrichum sojae]|uniref:Uncharacterized protein n=1 Tax=Colletotrichum sojae TaxID=2175907 RepID=A0A8H6JQ05_9PEZI|nr:hypothetical protein CSOJ01_02945 [Colletotrichum sojae]